MTNIEKKESGALCPTFSGVAEGDRANPTKSVEIFLRRFETYLEIKGIIPPSDENDQQARQRYERQRVGLLKAALKDKAAAWVYSLPEDTQHSYENVLRELQAAYGIDVLEAYTSFKGRKLKSEDNVDSFVALLRHDLHICLPVVTTDALLKLQLLAGLPSGSNAKVQALARDSAETSLDQLVLTVREQMRAARVDSSTTQGRRESGPGKQAAGGAERSVGAASPSNYHKPTAMIDRRPVTLLSALGPSLKPITREARFKLPSCDVLEEYVGDQVMRVTLEAPDCWAQRDTIQEGQKASAVYQWTVGWEWKVGERQDQEEEPPHIPGPKEIPGLLDTLTDDEFKDLSNELQSWVDKGWLVKVEPADEEKVRAVLPIVPVISIHRSTTARPTLNFKRVNSRSVQAADPYAASCPASLRAWRRYDNGILLDISKAYPSLHINKQQSWYQCIYIRFNGRHEPGQLYRLVKLGFGHASAPRLLKMTLDYILGPDEDTSTIVKESHKHPIYPVPRHLKYFDDILVPIGREETREQAQHNAEVIRSLLADNKLITKPPQPLDEARLLGLVIKRDGQGKLWWSRRSPSKTLVSFRELLLSENQAPSAREVSSWLGSLVAHLPVLSWLRPAVAISKRLLGQSIGRDLLKWDQPTEPAIINYCTQLCDELEQRGVPARGLWQLPQAEDLIHCYVDASDIAIACVMTDTANNIIYHTTTLRKVPKGAIKDSSHINTAELESAILGIETSIGLF
ncbi:hypothetical protein FOL47_009919 [Perkinsus chesapeaki]|uniref:DUF7047 domain-containing protein n=1 Tax=Perkinsus chesapeaki TaxID=330153 RepID=A0A7J6L5T6_PERCH|nr:hypothetical protein FOL47_009919 [Perkinsus chesapeaki]